MFDLCKFVFVHVVEMCAVASGRGWSGNSVEMTWKQERNQAGNFP